MGLFFLFCASVMLIPKKDRTLISKYLFEEGVMVAKKDYNAAKHPHVPCRNLYVIKLMQSFKSTAECGRVIYGAITLFGPLSQQRVIPSAQPSSFLTPVHSIDGSIHHRQDGDFPPARCFEADQSHRDGLSQLKPSLNSKTN